MEKPPAAAIPSDADRCIRNSGRNWRCAFPRFVGSRYCEKHHKYFIQRRANDKSEEDDVGYEAVGVWNKKKKKKQRHRAPKMKNLDEVVKNSRAGFPISMREVPEMGQIWAFSKDPDGFPRCYARIDLTFPSLGTVRATPLVLHPVSDEEMQLSRHGFSLACGTFRVSEYSFFKESSEFTHQVMADMEAEEGSFCKVFPNKGEIWAVYSMWDELKREFKYKLVEVIADFSEGDRVDVFRLIEVEDSENRVYKREENQGFYLVRSFQRGCMSTFSHQVPATRISEGGEVMWEVKLQT